MAGDVTRWATAVCAVLHCLGTDEAEPKRRQDGRCLSCWLSGWRTCSALAEFLQSILEALLWVLAWPMRFAPAAPTLTNQLQISILIKDSASRFSHSPSCFGKLSLPSRDCKNKSTNQIKFKSKSSSNPLRYSSERASRVTHKIKRTL